MKLQAFLLAAVIVVAAQAEQDIQVKFEWLNHVEKKCEGCSTQFITNKAGDWFVLGAKCGEGMVFLKVVSRWQGEAIEVSLTRQVCRDGDKFFDDGPSVSVTVRQTEVKQLELRGFKYAVSASAAPEKKPNQSPQPPRPTGS